MRIRKNPTPDGTLPVPGPGASLPPDKTGNAFITAVYATLSEHSSSIIRKNKPFSPFL
jgi:hypothetical protein